MTETKNPQHEPALPAKRKTNLVSQDHGHQQQTLPNKSPKLQTLDETVQPNQQNHALENDSFVHEPVPENEDTVIELEEEDKEEEDDDYEDDDDDEEEENGSTPVNRKGKGIMIEEVNDSDDEDDDDSSDGGDESEGESDLSDDPLAEVDLDNILPSRTRRRAAHPGLRIARGSDDSDS